MEKIKKVIIDTDIGDDIDDAYAMLFAHKTNKIDILGVTTVNKNVHQRAKITKYLFNKFNRKIDVYEGIDDPIKEEIKTFVFDKKNENGEYQIFQYRNYMEKEKTEKNAIDFILNKASEFPNEITLLCIGPLTNIGLAYKKNKEAFNKIKEIVIMGGCFDSNFAEFNIRCDTEAANLVLESECLITFIGFDITKNATLNDSDLDEIYECKDEYIEYYKEITSEYVKAYENKRRPTMHDPLALCYLLKEEYFNVESTPLVFDTVIPNRGRAVRNEGNRIVNYVASCDINKFKRYFIESIKK